MTPDDPRIRSLAAALLAVIDAVRAEGGPPSTDELIPLTVEALAARGLEHRPLVRLAEAGTLRSIRVGRRRFTCSKWLAELAQTLPVAVRRNPGVDDDVMDAVRARARRIAAREAKARSRPQRT